MNPDRVILGGGVVTASPRPLPAGRGRPESERQISRAGRSAASCRAGECTCQRCTRRLPLQMLRWCANGGRHLQRHFLLAEPRAGRDRQRCARRRPGTRRTHPRGGPAHTPRRRARRLCSRPEAGAILLRGRARLAALGEGAALPRRLLAREPGRALIADEARVRGLRTVELLLRRADGRAGRRREAGEGGPVQIRADEAGAAAPVEAASRRIPAGHHALAFRAIDEGHHVAGQAGLTGAQALVVDLAALPSFRRGRQLPGRSARARTRRCCRTAASRVLR